MQVFQQDKKSFKIFLNSLMKSAELIAPIKTDIARFEKVKDVDEIYLENNTYLPLKQYFFRQKQTLFEFNKNNIIEPKLNTPKRVFFGLRKCDLNAIRHQDMVYMEQTDDPYYTEARKKSILLGYHCNKAPSPYCFCESLDLVDFFDLMFYDKGKYFLVEVGSQKGKDLVQKHKSLFKVHKGIISNKEKRIPGADRLEKKDISALYDHPDWKKGVDICLSCAACTNLCPTCYCSEFHDEVNVQDPSTGKRIREWSSCQLPEFTRVAGNHVFRNEREHRFKHRIYHQLDYFKKKNGINLCVGCGRCISGCPTRIDFVDIINKM